MSNTAGTPVASLIPSVIPHTKVEIREWYVSVGEGEPVGPVSTDLVARGIVAGKVPRTAYVARVGDEIWQDVLDVPEIFEAVKRM